ncbi:MAG: thiol protease/hemagglutinin PrtT [Bacteroidales bacterium]|jgi:hypothetical protein|nr:thiol protease/hemagglutinin PrtT [Bacteroidales bacterium]
MKKITISQIFQGKIVLSALFALLCWAVQAGERPEHEAQQIAASFSAKSSVGLRAAHAPVLEYTRRAEQTVYYYVYNIGENEGFVIVSGDDRAREVLGYSTKGHFSMEKAPANMRYMLSCYETELHRLETGETFAVSAAPKPKLALRDGVVFAEKIDQLLSEIIWDQSAPFNNLCPLIPHANQRAVTGCVATGTSQIMRFHKYPATGKGSNSYTSSSNRIALSADFSKVTFDWDNMLPSYTEAGLTPTTAQNTAVATLIYNVGVSCNMDYGTSSGAYTMDMANALINNFGYDANLQYCQRDYYSEDEWIDLIKTELNQGRPVAYAGASTEGGHFFVCDGYDSDGLFHFNWGWSGMSDGFFQISALNPPAMGIGGSSGGFNLGQEMIIGIQPPSTSSVPFYQMYLENPLAISATQVNVGAPFIVSAMGINNEGVNNFSGKLGVGLFAEGGTFVAAYATQNATYPSGLYSESTTTNFSVTLPNTVAQGNYEMYVVFQPAGQSDWSIVRGKAGTLNRYYVSVSNGVVQISTPAIEFPQLAINSIELQTQLYQNEVGEITVSITNTGDEYNSLFRFFLKSSTNGTVTTLGDDEPVVVPAGETKVIVAQKNVTVAPGRYTLMVDYDANNDENSPRFVAFPTTLTVTVEATPTQAPAFNLLNQVSFADPQNVDKKFAELTVELQNNGGFFADYVIAFVFAPTGGNSIAFFGYQPLILDEGATETVSFTGYVDLEPGNYLVEIYYWDSNANNGSGGWSGFSPLAKSYTAFTLVEVTVDIPETPNSVNNVSEPTVSIYPNPASDRLTITSTDEIRSVHIVDIAGKQQTISYANLNDGVEINISSLSNGAYILRYETAQGSFAHTFVKK